MIAMWSFRKNRTSEHDQWIRDQKRLEWKDMLEATSQIEEAIPAVSTLQERYDAASQRLPQMLSRLLVIRGRCAFISDVLDNQETAEMFNNFVRSAASAAEPCKDSTRDWRLAQASGKAVD